MNDKDVDDTRLTFENHLQPDTRMSYWSRHGPGPYSEKPEFWVSQILAANLSDNIPENLHVIYERIQGCMVYGFYNYPLYTLAAEELFRFNESALRVAVSLTPAPPKVQNSNFATQIKWAGQNKLLSPSRAEQWDAGRSLRNSTTHKIKAQLFGPHDAIGQLYLTRELVEELFETVRTNF